MSYLKTIVCIICFNIFAFSTNAEESNDLNRILLALKLDRLFEEIREEGLIAAKEMQGDLKNSQSVVGWSKNINEIYSTKLMKDYFKKELTNLESLSIFLPAINFYEKPLGVKIIENELITRIKIRDDGEKEKARNTVKQLKYLKPYRFKLYNEIINANGFIEDNISSSMNSNLAFYEGYASGLATSDRSLTEREMISRIWLNQSETRKRMTDWVLNFSVTSFKNLNDNELREYLAFSNSKSGRYLSNNINFIFDKLFKIQSYKLGKLLAERSVSSGT
jgi:hypothetical protein